VLLRDVLETTRAGLYLAWEQPLAEEAWVRFRALLVERAAGRPVSYLTGHREFMGLDLLVDERALIPRADTEILVEFLLHELRESAAARVADVGTGSGAIAVALATYLPQAEVLAVDLSSEALELAAANVARHNVAARVHLAQGDLLAPVRTEGWTDLDAIASNPPYVNPEASLSREIREHEPAMAVIDPGGGTTFHARLTAESPALLHAGGWLALEVAAGQAPDVVELFEQTGRYGPVRVVNDLQGIERVVAARRR
jgi:release factor glutamine methyltransferase